MAHVKHIIIKSKQCMRCFSYSKVVHVNRSGLTRMGVCKKTSGWGSVEGEWVSLQRLDNHHESKKKVQLRLTSRVQLCWFSINSTFAVRTQRLRDLCWQNKCLVYSDTSMENTDILPKGNSVWLSQVITGPLLSSCYFCPQLLKVPKVKKNCTLRKNTCNSISRNGFELPV